MEPQAKLQLAQSILKISDIQQFFFVPYELWPGSLTWAEAAEKAEVAPGLLPFFDVLMTANGIEGATDWAEAIIRREPPFIDIGSASPNELLRYQFRAAEALQKGTLDETARREITGDLALVKERRQWLNAPEDGIEAGLRKLEWIGSSAGPAAIDARAKFELAQAIRQTHSIYRDTALTWSQAAETAAITDPDVQSLAGLLVRADGTNRHERDHIQELKHWAEQTARSQQQAQRRGGR
jgi:hypothetical protein